MSTKKQAKSKGIGRWIKGASDEPRRTEAASVQAAPKATAASKVAAPQGSKPKATATPPSTAKPTPAANTAMDGVPRAPAAPPAQPNTRSNASQRMTPPQSSTDTHHPDRQQMIADAAYFRAERRGFAPGHELEDWVAAERQIAEQLPSQ